MRFFKNKNCIDTIFQRVHNHYSESKYPSQYWAGYWWTIGTTGVWRTVYDTFYVDAEQIKDWEEYDPPNSFTRRD